MTEPNFREGPPRIFMPVSHPERRGGPIGYVERDAEDLAECPVEVRVDEENEND
ncbi:hypothetical protein KJ912_04655 [Patescibacteria group bacterium]|nr:hypothetical protein [Patescibacteria group bacterium]